MIFDNSKDYKDTYGNVMQFQYVWRFVPYEAKEPKFRIALHITPLDKNYNFKSYKDFPELANLMRRVLDNGVSSRLVPAIIIYDFDSTNSDIIGFINKTKDILKEAGIKQGRYVDLYSGFPNIFYGEEYLSHTIGKADFSLTDVISTMTGKCDVREQFGSMPVVGPQKFDPLKDTDVSYIDELLQKEINKINSRVMNLKQVVKDTIKDKKVKNSLDNIYTTENDDNWSKFQGMF